MREKVLAVNEASQITVEEIHFILVYLLQIVNFPMKKPTINDERYTNVVEAICDIIGRIIRFVDLYQHMRWPPIFLMTATVLDIICGTNYRPFVEKASDLQKMYEKLKEVADITNNLRYIDPKAAGRTEATLFDRVRFIYITPKAHNQQNNKKYSEDMKKWLNEHMKKNPTPPSIQWTRT